MIVFTAGQFVWYMYKPLMKSSTMSFLLKLHRIPVNAYMNLFPFFMGTPLSSVLFFLFLSPKGTIEYKHI